MQYISKGLVVKNSTEELLNVTRCGCDFQLTGIQAALWLNAQFGFDEVKDEMLCQKELQQLRRQELVELADAEDSDVGRYRALTQCVIVPAKMKRFTTPLSGGEQQLLKWIVGAGLRLSMAELVCLNEQRIRPDDSLLGENNRQALTEAIYTRTTIFDNILETRMERSKARDVTVKQVLSLLRKKRIVLL